MSGAPDPHAMPRPGAFLVAHPRLLDPNFMHAVVLLIDHGDHGTFGLIVNRPLPMTVGEVGPGVPLLAGRKDAIWQGGPVQKSELHILHRTGGEVPGSIPVVDEVAFDGDPAVLGRAIDAPGAQVRFIAGYAGWGEGQLAAEMAEESWIVVPATARRIFDRQPETLWRRVLRAEGGTVAELADVPPDPTWN